MTTPTPDIHAIFDAAVARETEEDRVQYLDEACRDAPDARDRVEALLRAHADAGGFFGGQATAPPLTDIRLVTELTEQPGDTIGPYKLLQQIGEGGMGVVYLAEQTEPVKRRVALKIIKPGMDTREVVSRFQAERQALALMDHPNIAKVLDAGATETGRPYFVMELVKGIPVTEYCDQCQLSTRDRLDLFVQICRAVQHAHQKGIIHRDVKPSNVLVAIQDGHPLPKVIDFGVAKAINQQLTDQTLLTRFAQIVGTPLYMSPEQAEMSALDVDTRSDIYSLGVLLYELLTGTTPFERQRLKEATYDEVRRIIREEEPIRPSARISTLGAEVTTIAEKRRTEPRKLQQVVRGDLDWIALKALEKDRTRRYETPTSFAEDINRFLNDEPVQACPPSAVYRFRKFARRNKAALMTTAVIGLTLMLGVASVGWLVRDRIAREQEAVRELAARRTRLAGQVELILDDADRLMRDEAWPEALAVARRAEPLIDSGEADAGIQRRVQQVLDELRFVERLEDARLLRSSATDTGFDCASANQAYTDAFREFGIDVENVPPEQTLARLRMHETVAVPIALALDDWSDARQCLPASNPADWQPLINLAKRLDPDPMRNRLRELSGRESDAENRSVLVELARSELVGDQPAATLESLGTALTSAGLLEEAIATLRIAQENHPDDFWINFQLAHTLEIRTPGDADAIRFYSVAIGVRPGNAAALNNLGNVFVSAMQDEQAIACYHRAIEVDPTFAPPHTNLGNIYLRKDRRSQAIAHYRTCVDLAPKYLTGLSNLAAALTKEGQFDDAIAYCRRAIELDAMFAPAHYHLGVVHLRQEKYDEAIAACRTAIELDAMFAPAHYYLGVAYVRQGKYDDAIASCGTAIELDPDYADAHRILGTAYGAQRMLGEAIASHRTAIDLDPENSEAHLGLGAALVDKGEYDQAIDSLHQAIELDSEKSLAHKVLGVAHLRQQQYKEAKACFRTAIQLDPSFADAHHDLGVALANTAELDQAIDSFQRAIELDPMSANAHANLGNVYNAQGRLDDAIACWRAAIERDPMHIDAHHNLGVALAKKEEFDESIDHLQIVIDLEPTHATACGDLGAVFLDQGELNEAIVWICKAIEADSGSASAHNNLGLAYMRQQQPEKAIACWRTAIECDSEFVDAHRNLGTVYGNRGEFDSAVEHYRRVVEIEPDSTTDGSYLAWCLTNTPNPSHQVVEEALKHARRAAESDVNDGGYRGTLGIALYRAGQWQAAIDALNQAHELRGSLPFVDQFFLAMAYWKVDCRDDAVREFEQAETQFGERQRPAWQSRYPDEARELIDRSGDPSDGTVLGEALLDNES